MFSGNFRSFAGISEESMWLTVVFSMCCNFVPGVSCILVLGFREFPAIREHVLRVFSVTSGCFWGILRGQCGLPLGLSMVYNLVPGVSGIIYGVSGGYNQLVLRVSDNSSTSFSVVFGHFRLFSGNSDVFIRLPLVSSLGCNSVPGVSCTFYGVVGGYSSTFLTGVFG